jgi:hypothetical protein
MHYNLKLLPEAKEDILIAYKIKNEDNLHPESHLLHHLTETIDYLGSNPKLFPRIYNHIRYAKVSQFNLNVFFMVDESTLEVIVLAII